LRGDWGLVNTALIGLSYIKAQLFPRRDETYLDAFFINRFGERLYETFFRGYTEKVWGSAVRRDPRGLGRAAGEGTFAHSPR